MPVVGIFDKYHPKITYTDGLRVLLQNGRQYIMAYMKAKRDFFILITVVSLFLAIVSSFPLWLSAEGDRPTHAQMAQGQANSRTSPAQASDSDVLALVFSRSE